MYSEALRIMDQISMQLMVDEMSQQIEESKPYWFLKVLLRKRRHRGSYAEA